MNGKSSVSDNSDIIVLEEDHLIGVLDDSWGIRGEEVLDALVGAQRVELGLRGRLRSSDRRLNDRCASSEFYNQ